METSALSNQNKEEKITLSRLGRKPIEIPEGVKVSLNGSTIQVEGKRGELSWSLPDEMDARVNGKQVHVFPKKASSETKSLHGAARKIVFNMVEGVTQGFQKKLVIEGVGFRAQVTGDKLSMQLGFSHPAVYTIPKDLKITVDPKGQNLLIIEGNDKQRVGQAAAEIRSIRMPEPYKGTGIRYENEVIKRKAGKAAVATTGVGAKKA